jgi:PAS domain S-box-containing protein
VTWSYSRDTEKQGSLFYCILLEDITGYGRKWLWGRKQDEETGYRYVKGPAENGRADGEKGSQEVKQFVESAKMYRAVFDSLSERVWHIDCGGRVESVNTAAARDLGLPVEAIVGKSLYDLFPPDMASRFLSDTMEIVASGEPKLGVLERYPSNRGTMERWLQTDKIPYRDREGNIAGVIVFAVDTTGYKRTEEALHTSQLQLFEAMDLARIVYWRLDPATETFTFNDPFYAFYGTTAEREGGYLMARDEYGRRFVHPDDLTLFRQAAEKRKSYGDREFFNDLEHRIIRRDGEVRHIIARIRASIDATGRTVRCYGANQDITDRKKAEEQLKHEQLLKEAQLRKEKALEESQEELRNLSEHLQRVRESERTRIAREVHDELGQFLSALKIDLTCLGRGLMENQGTLVEQIENMAKKIDTGVHTVRKICSELRPSILDDFGLPAAIEWHIEDFQHRTGIRFVSKIDATLTDVDGKLALIIFRIFQEAVTNMIRHAEARTVKVSLKKDTDNIVLKVSDDGKGISTRSISSPGSLGIIGMRERVRFWNGRLIFKSARNRGTTMTVSIPLETQTRETDWAGYPTHNTGGREEGTA